MKTNVLEQITFHQRPEVTCNWFIADHEKGYMYL